MRKRALSLLLALVMAAALLPAAAFAAESSGLDKFTDLSPDAYYLDAVEWAVENGITTGTGDGTTFSPNQVCSHVEIITFLWRAAGSPQSDTQPPESAGLTGEEYYYTALCWARDKGMVGYDFRANHSPCCRGDAVTYIWRALDCPIGPRPPEGVTPWFSDVNAKVPDAMQIAALWAVCAGVTNGTGDGTTFSPWNTCTRAEIVTFLYRACVPGARLDGDAAPRA